MHGVPRSWTLPAVAPGGASDCERSQDRQRAQRPTDRGPTRERATAPRTPAGDAAATDPKAGAPPSVLATVRPPTYPFRCD
eukprot:scaffold4404_cov383-Prasinococcus_capsulatus_cf.AAC.8